jgi:predicted DNA-binding transcriptional regulator AlpA
MDDILLPPSAAAERLHLKTRTLMKWRMSGKGPRYSKIGSRIRYRAADIEQWLTENSYTRRDEEPKPGVKNIQASTPFFRPR